MVNEEKPVKEELELNVKVRDELRKSLLKGIKQILVLNKIIEENWKSRQVEVAGKCEILIPVFDGQDYCKWNKRIVLYLRFKKCNDVIEKQKQATDKEDWEERDLKAMNYFYNALTNKKLEFVANETTAYDIMKKLDSMYLKESTALQIVCRNKLDRIRLEKYSESETFFNEFEKLFNELKSAGANVGEKEKLDYMINALPESYSHIGDLIDTLKEEERN